MSYLRTLGGAKRREADKKHADRESDKVAEHMASSLSYQELNRADRARLQWVLDHERFVDCDQSYERVTLAWLEAVDTRTMSRSARQSTIKSVLCLKNGQIYYAHPFRGRPTKPPLAVDVMPRPLKPPTIKKEDDDE